MRKKGAKRPIVDSVFTVSLDMHALETTGMCMIVELNDNRPKTCYVAKIPELPAVHKVTFHRYPHILN